MATSFRDDKSRPISSATNQPASREPIDRRALLQPPADGGQRSRNPHERDDVRLRMAQPPAIGRGLLRDRGRADDRAGRPAGRPSRGRHAHGPERSYPPHPCRRTSLSQPHFRAQRRGHGLCLPWMQKRNASFSPIVMLFRGRFGDETAAARLEPLRLEAGFARRGRRMAAPACG